MVAIKHGHYKGAYTTIFGTATPDLTPWHMLGHSFKPIWWDDYFSWTDTTKRAALIDALIKGNMINGIIVKKQDVKYARRYWDWTTIG